MSEVTKKAAEWWSDPQSEAPETQWVRVPGVVENMNRRATGDPAIDWINHSAGLLSSFAKPIKALSVGCGFGDHRADATPSRFLPAYSRCGCCRERDRKRKENSGSRRLGWPDLRSRRFEHCQFPVETYDVVYAHARCIMFFSLNTFSTKLNKR